MEAIRQILETHHSVVERIYKIYMMYQINPVYSDRSATSGSTRVARRAGM